MNVIRKALATAFQAFNKAVVRYDDSMAYMGEKIIDITTFGLLKKYEAKKETKGTEKSHRGRPQ